MRRKLVLLNLVLATLIGGAAWRLRVQWLAEKEHEKVMLGQKVKPAPAPEHVAAPAVQPVVPAQYIEIANKDLFTKERNPTIVVEPPAPPPPPPPMPSLPVIKGILNIDGVTAIMSENPKAMQKEVHPGENIGEFKLLAINNQEIVLEWNGKEVRRNVAELFDHSTPEPAAAPAAGNTPAAAPAAKPAMAAKAGPGVDMGAGRKACVAGDDSPAGTVVDGMKKYYWDSPLGKGCYWEVPK